jgi:enoyl-CoA hydratase/carnithine racemase
MTAPIVFELVSGVGIITLNRPDRHNAMNDEASALLGSTFQEALRNPDVRAILMRGAGKSFCSGRDTSVLGHRVQDESDYHFVRRHQEFRLTILESPKPVVAAVKGAAIGGGCEMALAADIRVASTDLKMALPEINYGLLPDTGGTQYLTNLIGPARAKYMVMTGARIDGQTALDWGAVDFLLPPEDVDAKALQIATDIAAKPPIALAMAKSMIDQGMAGAVRSGLTQELLAQTALFKTDDYAEARAAVREGRKPVYKGR